jgi:3D (Asp-Asp-Asp) domain-containing protein
MRHLFTSPIISVILAAVFALNTGAEDISDIAAGISQPYAAFFNIQSGIDLIQAYENEPPQSLYYGAAPEYLPEDYPEAFAEIAPTLFFNGVIPEVQPTPLPKKQKKQNEYLKTQTAAHIDELADVQILKTINVSATAYTTERQRNKTTATGTTARVGAIAVDPKVIPYGTRLYIAAPDNSWVYGYATAEDCGGGIKKNKVDLFFDTYDECISFGVQKAVVYVLGE